MRTVPKNAEGMVTMRKVRWPVLLLAGTLLLSLWIGFSGSPGLVLIAESQAWDKSPSGKITPQGHASIRKGTRWLVRAIRRDGGVGSDLGLPPDLGCTAITGLALLSQGNTPRGGPQARELRLVLDYLLQTIEQLPPDTVPVENGTLIQRKIGRYAPLFLMTLFLSQVYGEVPGDEAAVREALIRMSRVICAHQQADGTWGTESWAPILGTVLGWESLRACASIGIPVSASTEKIGQAMLASLRNRSAEDAGGWMLSFYKETASLRVLYSLGYDDDPLFRECVERMLKLPIEEPRLILDAGGEEYLAFFLVTECMLKRKQTSWATWYPLLSERMVRVQNGDGSWSGHHCITSRTFCTAAALMMLQAPNQCLPISDL